MGIFISNKHWATQARIQGKRDRAAKAARWRSKKQSIRRNRRHAIEHPISHAWSLFRSRNK
jgi:hypothetical protein